MCTYTRSFKGTTTIGNTKRKKLYRVYLPHTIEVNQLTQRLRQKPRHYNARNAGCDPRPCSEPTEEKKGGGERETPEQHRSDERRRGRQTCTHSPPPPPPPASGKEGRDGRNPPPPPLPPMYVAIVGTSRAGCMGREGPLPSFPWLSPSVPTENVPPPLFLLRSQPAIEGRVGVEGRERKREEGGRP